MQIEFQGAALTTTGSRHLLHIEDKKILLDCGLYQGRRKESYEKNKSFPFDPSQITDLLLSHAHIDHCGNIPNLVKKGFSGQVYCTSATQDLCSTLLRDSAHIQEKDVEYLNKKLVKKNQKPVEPLYTMEDAERCLYNFHGVYYHRTFNILRDVKVTFFDAGHILGSALTVIDVRNGKKGHRILFTGDLGRKNMPILRNPEIPPGVNTLIIESTYGKRIHGDIRQSEDKLEKIINKVAERKGKIIVPAFSVGRTQELVYGIKRLIDGNRIPKIPVYVDSPLSANVTEIFRQHYECYDAPTRDLFLKGEDPFGFCCITYVRKVEESKRLNDMQDPCIIISASGMCEAGRILHHLKNNVENPANLILIVGFMAVDTLGRKIVDREPVIRIFGESYSLKAEVEIMNEFSAHADSNELQEFIRALNKNGTITRIFIVHGEEAQATALANSIKGDFKGEVIIPQSGEIFQID